MRSEALLLQADALVALKRYDQALDLLSPAAASPAVAAKHAEVLYRAGRERQARRQLDKLAARTIRRRSSPPPRPSSGWRTTRIRSRCSSACSPTHPKLTTAGFLLGAAYERNGQRDKAVATFRRVLKIDPDFHAALNYLGYTFAEEGENLDEALKLIRRAVALDPDNGAYVDSLGWTYFRLRQLGPARTYLERATRLEPEDATVQEHLGDVYVALGEAARARQVPARLELGDENVEQVRRKLGGLPESSSARP